MDDLSVTLNNAKVGRHINNRCANHMLYADDLCVIAIGVRANIHLVGARLGGGGGSSRKFPSSPAVRPIRWGGGG